jgi:hypothetical protein
VYQTLIVCLFDGHLGHDCMVVGFKTTYEISAYHHWCCEFKSWSGRDEQHYVIKFVSKLATGRWFSQVLQSLDRHNRYRTHDLLYWRRVHMSKVVTTMFSVTYGKMYLIQPYAKPNLGLLVLYTTFNIRLYQIHLAVGNREHCCNHLAHVYSPSIQ